MLSLSNAKMWYRMVKVFDYTYYLPISTIQVLVFRNRNEELFYGTFAEVRKLELTKNR